MSLGNWDYKAWDENGKNTVPIFRCFDETEIELYKNWVYIRTDDKTFTIFNGELEGNSFYLYAERVKLQDAIFVAIREWNSDRKFFGIGAYGWNDDVDYNDWIGISDALGKRFIEWVKSLPEKTINPIVEKNDIPSSFEGI